MNISDDERALLNEVLDHLGRTGVFPAASAFRVEHERQRTLIDELVSSQHLREVAGRYVL